MPTKRKFTAKFPTARIKKIMQLDDEIGKLSATVPPVVCNAVVHLTCVARALELFIEQLLTKAYDLTLSRNSKTILPSYLKEIIDNEEGFAFLRPLVAHIAPVKSLDESRSRVRSTSSEGKPKQRRSTNGTQGRKRHFDNESPECLLSDDSGPSHSKRNGYEKSLRSEMESGTHDLT
ncbi:unnamed protein product [Mesocestoides corti]|uniref:Transcription factor CBF/NF-Y/archaeal histone domain-containing protein n=1 Tax=Mesocestoides corti TaxID=53468 RepID=A0A0R3UAH5_MESCO|nr:unnamed protein product [Mesocestoides corti]